MPILDSSAFADSAVLPARLRCDVCIIGSGPAGITIARELSGTSLRVTILESGGAERQEASDALNEIESVGWPRVMDQWAVRNRMLGGSSSTWSGRCAPFDEIDMQYRDWVPHSGWPFEISDLMAYIDRSAKHLGLGAGNGITDDRVWALTGHRRVRTGPDPDPGKLLPMFWQYGRDPVNQYDRIRFSHFAPDLGPNVTLVTNATVLRINAKESCNAVESVEFATANRRRWTLPASTVVLCGGGIENTRLLLSSDNVAKNGLGNDKDLVGRFLMDHLRGPVARFRSETTRGVLNQFASFKSPSAGSNSFQHGMRLSPVIQRVERLLNCSAWVHEHLAADDPWESLILFLRREAGTRPDFRSMLRNSGLLIYGLKEHFISHRALPRKLVEVTLEAMCEQVPNPDSRITLSRQRDHLGMQISHIDWRVGDEEARAMRRIAELMVDEFPRMGIDPPELEEWVRDGAMFPQTFRDVAHPTGTTRMAEDPAQGVVDSHCQVHGVHGLFIAGSSVFPTAGQANPTQMIVALAVRLADTLKDRVTADAGIGTKSVSGSLGTTPEVESMLSGRLPRVLVTGATGKIGRHVVNELLARGYQVRAVTSKPVDEARTVDNVEWRQLDFQKSLDFEPLVRECEAVLHLGAEITVIERMQRSNVDATRVLAEASERAGVKFFCYTSSVSVYGSSRRRRVSEDSPVLTSDHDVPSEYWATEYLRCYGRTKLQGERAIGEAARNVEYVILRPTVVVDIEDLVELGEWSTPKKQRAASRHAHHVYVHDVADAILWFMEQSLTRDQPSPGVGTFNFAEDDAAISRYAQLFDSAYEVTGDKRWRVAATPWPLEWLWATLLFRRLTLRQPFGRMLFSSDKLRETGYKCRFGMSSAISIFHEELTNGNDKSEPPVSVAQH